MLTFVLMAAGAVVVLVAWRLVARGVVSVWTAMGTVAAAAGGTALATGRVSLSPGLWWPWAVAAGAAAGVALYLATVAFVHLVARWPPFERHVSAIYDQRKGLSLRAALLVAAGVTAPGEELFWRGLFQSRLAEVIGWVGASVATWGTYVAANASSRSLPIVAGAVVSGAVWGALALWTHGVLASTLCHVVWTGLMVAFPPTSARERLGPVRRGRADDPPTG